MPKICPNCHAILLKYARKCSKCRTLQADVPSHLNLRMMKSRLEHELREINESLKLDDEDAVIQTVTNLLKTGKILDYELVMKEIKEGVIELKLQAQVKVV